MSTTLFDGLDALRAELTLADIMRLIERTARWVSKETFRRLPVWYPEHSRRGLFYKNDWTEPQYNTNRQISERVHKREGNLYANKALTHALGLRSDDRPNWSCCHIWGVDDATYASTNVIVQDARFYSCVGNMLLLPSPLKAFTDVMPEIKAMLRACAFFAYDWRCGHEGLEPIDLRRFIADPAYPASWPKSPRDSAPPGTVVMTEAIAGDAERRLDRIRRDLREAGVFYPRDQVRAVLDYWGVVL